MPGTQSRESESQGLDRVRKAARRDKGLKFTALLHHVTIDLLRSVGITQKKANWILDLDVRSFFDKVGHDWMIQFVEHRVGDQRIFRLLRNG